MKQFLVIKSEHATSGRGVNGRTLYKFLRTYVGNQGVDFCSLDQLRDGRGMQAEYVFLGMPGDVTKEHLAKLKYRHLILFDLSDWHRLMWDDSNRELLKGITGHYYKAWWDERWDFGMQMGVLPIRRYRKLHLALEMRRLSDRLGRKAPERQFDAMFLGFATGTRNPGTTAATVYNERVEWMLEVKRKSSGLNLWGGLCDTKLQKGLEARYGDLADIMLSGKTSFWKYFRVMQQSRVALTPQGNAPWSYRHYEAIYAGAVVVTSDFHPMRTLVPLPLANMIHVTPGDPVLPAIAKGLALRRDQPQVIAENIQHLERYLEQGMYSRRRPELYERFLSQLPTSTSAGRIPPEPEIQRVR